METVVYEASVPYDPDLPVTRRDRKRQEMYNRIYRSAIELLSLREFDSVTVEEITEAADVGKGTFFRHFASKEAVIAAYFEETRDLLVHALEDPEPELQDRISPEAYGHGVHPGPIWKRFVGTTYLAASRDGRSHRLIRTLLALSAANDTVRAASLSAKAQLVQTITAYMKEGQRTGEFRADFAPEALASFTRNLYYGTQLAWAQTDDDSRFENHIASSIALAWFAVRKSGEEVS